MIISEIGNIIPNFQIPYRSLNEVQCFSQSAHQFSFYDVVGCEVQSDYNFEFLSYVDPVSFSMMGNFYGTDLIELTKWGDFINFLTEFIPLGDFWITIIFDEVFFIDGKTHLDSVAEAVFNAVLGALESFVKAVKELASKVFDWIWNAIKGLFKPIIEPISKAFQQFVNYILQPFKFLTAALDNGKLDLKKFDMLSFSFNLFLVILFNPVSSLMEILSIILLTINTLTVPYCAIISTLVNSIVDFILPIVISMAGQLFKDVSKNNILAAIINGNVLGLIGIVLDYLPDFSSSGRTELDPGEETTFLILEMIAIAVGIALIFKDKILESAKGKLETLTKNYKDFFVGTFNSFKGKFPGAEGNAIMDYLGRPGMINALVRGTGYNIASGKITKLMADIKMNTILLSVLAIINIGSLWMSIFNKDVTYAKWGVVIITILSTIFAIKDIGDVCRLYNYLKNPDSNIKKLFLILAGQGPLLGIEKKWAIFSIVMAGIDLSLSFTAFLKLLNIV
jgi:hypothetical protein